MPWRTPMKASICSGLRRTSLVRSAGAAVGAGDDRGEPLLPVHRGGIRLAGAGRRCRDDGQRQQQPAEKDPASRQHRTHSSSPLVVVRASTPALRASTRLARNRPDTRPRARIGASSVLPNRHGGPSVTYSLNDRLQRSEARPRTPPLRIEPAQPALVRARRLPLVQPSLARDADGLRQEGLGRQAADRDPQQLVRLQPVPHALQAAGRGGQARRAAGRRLSARDADHLARRRTSSSRRPCSTATCWRWRWRRCCAATRSTAWC